MSNDLHDHTLNVVLSDIDSSRKKLLNDHISYFVEDASDLAMRQHNERVDKYTAMDYQIAIDQAIDYFIKRCASELNLNLTRLEAAGHFHRRRHITHPSSYKSS